MNANHEIFQRVENLLLSAKGFLLDIDGVLIQDGTPIGGAVQFINLLISRHIPFLCVTNTSYISSQTLVAKLRDAGFVGITNENIYTSLKSARMILEEKGIKDIYPLLTDDARKDFQGMEFSERKPTFIVMGDMGEKLSYSVMNRAFQKLTQGASLLAAHKSRFWHSEGGLKMDLGGFVTALEFASGQSAIVAGKPSTDFFSKASERLGIVPEDLVVIGDDFEIDILGAEKANVPGILVKTGKYRKSLIEKFGYRPKYIIDSIATALEILSKN